MDPEIDLCESGKASVNNYIIHCGVTIKSDHTVRGIRTGGGSGVDVGGRGSSAWIVRRAEALEDKTNWIFLTKQKRFIGK